MRTGIAGERRDWREGKNEERMEQVFSSVGMRRSWDLGGAEAKRV